MAQVKFKRTDDIENLPIDDGSFIVDYENQKAYTDVGENRIQFAGATEVNNTKKTSSDETYSCTYINSIEPVLETSTDANGWVKLVFNTHTEYVRTIFRENVTFTGNMWGYINWESLPVGMSTLGDRILTSSIGCADSAIMLNVYCPPSYSHIDIAYNNKYDQQIVASVWGQFRILEYV